MDHVLLSTYHVLNEYDKQYKRFEKHMNSKIWERIDSAIIQFYVVYTEIKKLHQLYYVSEIPTLKVIFRTRKSIVVR